MNPSPLRLHPKDYITYLTGCSNDATRAIGRQRDDFGVLVTPLLPNYLGHVGDYKGGFAVDNGAFSKTVPFDPEAFRTLVQNVAASPHRSRCHFVAAPDVVGDPVATRENFRTWGPELRASGLPVAFVLQDGCERMADGIPWDECDVLFVGGSTKWKVGDLPLNQLRPIITMFRKARELGIPVHAGRVNSFKRLEIVGYGCGWQSADGTFVAFGPDQNLPKVVDWLETMNTSRLHAPAPFAAKRQPTLI